MRVMHIAIVCGAGLLAIWQAPAHAHDIYAHLVDKSGRSCCDGSDCRPAPYRAAAGGVEMLVDERWIRIPAERIEYRAIEGDGGGTAGGHWCGEQYEAGFITWCAFLPPRLALAVGRP